MDLRVALNVFPDITWPRISILFNLSMLPLEITPMPVMLVTPDVLVLESSWLTLPN